MKTHYGSRRSQLSPFLSTVFIPVVSSFVDLFFPLFFRVCTHSRTLLTCQNKKSAPINAFSCCYIVIIITVALAVASE